MSVIFGAFLNPGGEERVQGCQERVHGEERVQGCERDVWGVPQPCLGFRVQGLGFRV